MTLIDRLAQAIDIDLIKILHAILKAKPQAVLFEAANSRHQHEWKVWAEAKLPEDKVLIPGLIDSCSNYVEHPELVAQGVERFAAVPKRKAAGVSPGGFKYIWFIIRLRN